MRLIFIALAIGFALLAGGIAVHTAGRPGMGPTVDILAAATDLAPGERLDPTRLKWAAWPITALSDGHIQRPTPAAALADWRDWVVLARLTAGEPVYRAKIERPEGGVLATMIDKDSRAVTIAVNDVGGVGGFALPRDRVDVLFTPHEARGTAAPSQVLVRDVRVLAINQVITSEGASLGSAVRTATLEVREDQARDLVQAGVRGSLALSLRPVGAVDPPPVPPPEMPVAPPPFVAPLPDPPEAPERTITVFRGLAKESVRISP